MVARDALPNREGDFTGRYSSLSDLKSTQARRKSLSVTDLGQREVKIRLALGGQFPSAPTFAHARGGLVRMSRSCQGAGAARRLQTRR
jgi:hypothetical protein